VEFWAGIVPANVDDLDGMAAAGVRGFKCFLTDSGNPNFPHLSSTEFHRAAAHVARLDSVLLVHAEHHDDITQSEAVREGILVVLGVPARRGRGARRGPRP